MRLSRSLERRRLRSTLVAIAVIATGLGATTALPAHAGPAAHDESSAPHGMTRMHELMMDGNPGMARMHERMRARGSDHDGQE